LLEAIAGLLPVASGEIRFRNQPLPARRRREVVFYLADGIRPTQIFPETSSGNVCISTHSPLRPSSDGGDFRNA
jgi:hypothetical protein